MTSSSVIRQLLPGGREPVHSYQQVTFKQQRMKTTTNMASEFGLMAGQALRVVMPGKVALPGEDSYLQARQIYNGALNISPRYSRFVRLLQTFRRRCALLASITSGYQYEVEDMTGPGDRYGTEAW
jgi:hypothetical protein